MFSFEQSTWRVFKFKRVKWNDADRHWRADRIILHRELFSTSDPPLRCIVAYAHLVEIGSEIKKHWFLICLSDPAGRKVYFGCKAKESVGASVWTSVGWIRQAVLQRSSGEIIQLKEHTQKKWKFPLDILVSQLNGCTVTNFGHIICLIYPSSLCFHMFLQESHRHDLQLSKWQWLDSNISQDVCHKWTNMELQLII